ncbi:MAG: nucleotidyltransferase domain-containing protein [Ignavibacteriales bacterium]|nr:nucleotidyltransferase domain-containing protein [Ignavibacteriales bacterium]
MTALGLRSEDIQKLCSVIEKFPEVESAIIYGSRAKGNFKPGSDIDLTLTGGNISYTTLTAIMHNIDELNLSYKTDISMFETIENIELKEHIRRVGKTIYNRGE